MSFATGYWQLAQLQLLRIGTGYWHLAAGSTATASNMTLFQRKFWTGFAGWHVQPSQPPVASCQLHYLKRYF